MASEISAEDILEETEVEDLDSVLALPLVANNLVNQGNLLKLSADESSATLSDISILDKDENNDVDGDFDKYNKKHSNMHNFNDDIPEAGQTLGESFHNYFTNQIHSDVQQQMYLQK